MVSRDDVEAALQTRAGVAEMERALAQKADASAIEACVRREEVHNIVAAATRENRVAGVGFGMDSFSGSGIGGMSASAYALNAGSLRDVVAMLDQKANAQDVEVLLNSKVDRKELQEALDARPTVAEVDSRLQSHSKEVAAEVQQALVESHGEIITVLNKKAYKSDARSLKQQWRHLIRTLKQDFIH